ncbi:MAG TPA: type II toxin-antitoxin system prevent-host-death family antitoxin [Steroidobacteraceae bacterium]|nr:type II toxin-antitoxin system prevent-host-death family antitoxin [Steroidobacteraceae bacterium]
MTEVGVFEAKTRLSELLERVAAGEEITITRRGQPVARLVAPGKASPEQIRRTIDEVQQLARGQRLEGLDWRALRDEGRNK